MRRAKIANVQSNINVTPLVDVVLVLLIIFMVMAPQLGQDENVVLPKTEQAPKKVEQENQIVIAIEHGGTIWIGDKAVTADGFASGLAEVAGVNPAGQVVIKADNRLTYGDVRSAMLAVERAGFDDVGLIAEQLEVSQEG